MEYRFNAEEWEGLTPAERARRCRVMAEEAQKLADGAPVHMAKSYLRMAEEWLLLANEIDGNKV